MSGIQVDVNGHQADLYLSDNSLSYKQGEVETTLKYEDIIGVKEDTKKENGEKVTRKIYYVSLTTKKKLEQKTLQITASTNDVDRICADIEAKLKKVEGRPKSVVVFLNPISGSANAESLYRNQVEPIFKRAEIETKLVLSEKADHFKELSESFDFTPYDALIIIGGDGTMNEILNGLIRRKQRSCEIDINDRNAILKTVDIPMGFIPAGTGNGLAIAAHGCYDVVTATLSIIKGKMKKFPVFSNYVDNKLITYSQLMTGYGMFGDMMYLIDQHRWMRKLRYVFIPIWFFLAKTLRTFDCELTFEYLEDKNDGNSTEQNTETRFETIQLNMTSVFALVMGESFQWSSPDPESRTFPVMVFKPCSRFSALKNFFLLVRTVSKEEMDRCEYIDIHFVRSVTVKVPNSQSHFDLMVNIDGEIYKVSKPEIHFRLVKDAYKIFSALDTSSETSQGSPVD